MDFCFFWEEHTRTRYKISRHSFLYLFRERKDTHPIPNDQGMPQHLHVRIIKNAIERVTMDILFFTQETRGVFVPMLLCSSFVPLLLQSKAKKKKNSIKVKRTREKRKSRCYFVSEEAGWGD